MTLKEIIYAARHSEPLSRELTPVENFVFEVAMGPREAPLPWAAVGMSVLALLFVSVIKLSVPSSIRVTSDPRGAEVTVDGKVLGTTPLRITKLEHGSHTVQVRMNGYEPRILYPEIAAFAGNSYAVSLAKIEEAPAPEKSAGAPTSVVAELLGKKATSTAKVAKPTFDSPPKLARVALARRDRRH